MSKIIFAAIAGVFLGGWAVMAVTVLADDYIEWRKEKQEEQRKENQEEQRKQEENK